MINGMRNSAVPSITPGLRTNSLSLQLRRQVGPAQSSYMLSRLAFLLNDGRCETGDIGQDFLFSL